MTITLNLLSEEQVAHEASSRDPVRLAIGIGAVIVSGTVLCGSLLSVVASRSTTELNLLRSQIKAMSGRQGMSAKSDWQIIQNTAEDILCMNRQRVMCAPQLSVIKDLVPASVHLARVSFAIATVLQGSAEPPVPDDPVSGAKARRLRAPQNMERMTLRLEGRAAGRRPEMEVNAFMQTLRDNPQFNSDVDQIQLRSIARTPTGENNQTAKLSSVSFVIECQYKERK